MKKVLLTLLTIVVVLGLFAAAGFAGYRMGYMRGAQTQITANGNSNGTAPQIRPFGDLDRRGMPMDNFGSGRGFQREFPRGFGGFPRMGMGFGLFGLFGGLMRIALFGLIIWFAYWLFTRSGWRLTRAVPASETTAPPAPAATSTETEVREEKAPED